MGFRDAKDYDCEKTVADCGTSQDFCERNKNVFGVWRVCKVLPLVLELVVVRFVISLFSNLMKVLDCLCPWM